MRIWIEGLGSVGHVAQGGEGYAGRVVRGADGMWWLVSHYRGGATPHTEAEGVREERMGPHMLKIHVPGLGVIHHFIAPDGGDPHDHPWDFRSTILRGSYIEEVFDRQGRSGMVRHNEGETFEISRHHVHRITHLPEGECWTCIDAYWQQGTQPVHFYQFRNGEAWVRSYGDREWRRVE